MDKLKRKQYSDLIELGIVFAFLFMIITIYVPSMIWEEENEASNTARFNIQTVYDIEYFYRILTDKYESDGLWAMNVVNAVRDSVLADSTYLGERNFELIGQNISVNIPDGFDVEYGSINMGSNDNSLEAFVNLPIGSNIAARLSAYDVQDGGWIDNQPSSFTYRNNGINYTIDNTTEPYDVAGKDYNDSSKEGARLRIRGEFENFDLDLSFLTQDSVNNGSYETDILIDLQTARMPQRTNTRYAPEKYDDTFDQMSFTLSGSISDDIDVVLTSSIFERDTEYTYDYSSYVEYYYFAAYSYYVCNYYEYYGYYYIDINDCRDPRMTYSQGNSAERTATEIRVSSNNDSGFNWVLGAFQETNEKVTDVDYLQPGATFYSNGLSGTWWEADLDRTGEIEALFGEAYIDIGEKTQLTLGFRDYEQDMKLLASNGYYGDKQYGLIGGNFTSSESGTIPKINLKHNIKKKIYLSKGL